MGLALTALGLLVVAESFQRTFGVSRTLVLQAFDQVGEVRLADVRHGFPEPSLTRRLVVQLLLVFPFFLILYPVLLPGGPLLWPVGLIPILQYAWSVPGGWLTAFRHPWEAGKVAPLAVLGLVFAVHPLLLDKSSWDFIPPGVWLFVLAWLLERRGKERSFALALGLASWCHPAQGVMALFWAADHLRRNWPGSTRERRRQLGLFATIVAGMAIIPLVSLALATLLEGERSLLHSLAPYARARASWHLRHGHLSWVGITLVGNLVKLAVILVSLGLVPILRWNRFLVYASFELAYSMLTTNGFIHGSLPGFLGILACATLEVSGRVSAEALRRAAWIAAATLLPLTLWWSSDHMAVQLLTNRTENRLADYERLLEPGDRDRFCVGQAVTYTVFAGRCKEEGLLRLPGGIPGSRAREADVYLLDFSVLPWAREASGIRAGIEEDWYDRLHLGPMMDMTSLDVGDEPTTQDAAWLKEQLEAGTLVITRNEAGRLRLERRRLGTLSPGSPSQRDVPSSP